jgi:hypothetical protein
MLIIINILSFFSWSFSDLRARKKETDLYSAFRRQILKIFCCNFERQSSVHLRARRRDLELCGGHWRLLK